MNAPLIKGWCPSDLRPMESGDGLIVRLKISGGIVDCGLALAIARWARLWGNGHIDLTSRANLQLRGVSARTLPSLHMALADRGLLGRAEDGDIARNIISSPLTGLDSDAVLDARPIVASLERRLARDIPLHGLPAKFGFLIDDGGSLGLAGVAGDIRFEARSTAIGPVFDIGLDGAEDERLGPCCPDAVADAASALSAIFLRYQNTDIRRMRDLVAKLGVKRIANEAGLAYAPRVEKTETSSKLLNAMPLGRIAFCGVGLAFGRILAEDLTELVETAQRYGAREIRLSPWRALLIPFPSIHAAREMAAWAAKTSWIVTEGDPRRRVAACVGMPSCPQATTAVRDDAAHLAVFTDCATGSDIVFHISGCGKGCAHPASAPITLVGRDGRYDLVLEGSPSDAPTLRELTLVEAADHLRRITANAMERTAI